MSDTQTQAAAQTPTPARERTFDFSAPAELFPSRGKKGRSTLRYRRFTTAAEAVRFAVEDISATLQLGAYLEVNEARFGMPEIQALYAHPAFPLKRTNKPKVSDKVSDAA
jgi:hypothetical protein